ncbi:hypothetical protein R3P38DRAFT_2785218 [Favolaschia claudopus]|uniref:Uncharacterized protein n=1 Tax=Favolaschia claudopus TaxID=2862362 RepID=A0AAW0ATT3_9AGAR
MDFLQANSKYWYFEELEKRINGQGWYMATPSTRPHWALAKSGHHLIIESPRKVLCDSSLLRQPPLTLYTFPPQPTPMFDLRVGGYLVSGAIPKVPALTRPLQPATFVGGNRGRYRYGGVKRLWSVGERLGYGGYRERSDRNLERNRKALDMETQKMWSVAELERNGIWRRSDCAAGHGDGMNESEVSKSVIKHLGLEVKGLLGVPPDRYLLGLES